MTQHRRAAHGQTHIDTRLLQGRQREGLDLPCQAFNILGQVSEKTRQQVGGCLLGSGIIQVGCNVTDEIQQSIASVGCAGVES